MFIPLGPGITQSKRLGGPKSAGFVQAMEFWKNCGI